MKAKLTLASLLAMAALGGSNVHAQQTWDGETDTTFDTGSNWVSGTAPTTTQTATFGASVTANQPNLTASRTIGGLIFQSTTGGWTLSGAGNTLTVGGSGIVDSATSGFTNIAPTIAIGTTRSFSTSGGTLRLNGGLQLTNNGGLTGTTGTIEVSSISYEGAETTNTFLKSGGATVNITGAAQSGWVGAITLQQGGLNVGNNTALGGGTLTWSNSSTFGAVSDVTIANTFVHGPGTHTYVGNNNINRTGTTTTTGVAGQARSFANTMGGGAVLTLGGNVYLSNDSGTGRLFTFNTGSSTGTTLISGSIQNFDGGPGTAGSVALGSSASSGGTVILSGANTYTGNTTMSGTVTGIFRNTASRSAGTTVSVGGTNVVGLGVGGAGFYSESDVQNLFANTLAGFSLAAGSDVGIDTTAGNFTYSVNQGGTRDLVKLGANTLTLTGNNSYTGATIVSQGTLLINGSTAAGSAVSVASGAVLGGNGTINGNLTLASGALLVFDTAYTLTLGGTLALDSSFGVASLRDLNGGAINWAGISDGTYTLLNTTFTFNSGNISNFGEANAFAIGGGRTAYFQNGSLDLVVVPEPSTWALLALGLTMFVMFRRRRSA